MAPIDSFALGIIRCIFPSSSPSFVAFAFVIVVIITILIAAIIFLIRDGVQLGLVSSHLSFSFSLTILHVCKCYRKNARVDTSPDFRYASSPPDAESFARPGLRGFCDTLCHIPQVNYGNAHKDYCLSMCGLSIKLTAASAKSNQHAALALRVANAQKCLRPSFLCPSLGRSLRGSIPCRSPIRHSPFDWFTCSSSTCPSPSAAAACGCSGGCGRRDRRARRPLPLAGPSVERGLSSSFASSCDRSIYHPSTRQEVC